MGRMKELAIDEMNREKGLSGLYKFDKAVTRAIFGFFAFIPFCWFWGVESFTLFAFVGTVYFVPDHWIFDKVMKDAR